MEDSGEQRIPIRRLLISVVMVMVSTIPVFLAGAAFIQLEQDIGLTATSMGAVVAAFFLTASITSTPLGRLVERIGWRTAFRVNCVVSAFTGVLIALLVKSPLSLGLFVIVSGATYGFTNPAANLALARGTPPSRRGVVFGLKHAGIPASTLAAGAAVPLLVLTVGWRPTFAMASLFAVLAWILIRFEPETDGDRARPDAIPSTGNPLSQRQLVILALGSSLATWAAVYLGAFLVAAAVDASFTESQAGILLFVGSAASIAARVVYGLWADRRSAAGLGAIGLIMATGAVAFGLTAYAAGAAFVIGVVAGFALGWGWPGLMTYAVVNTNANAAASSSAITQAGIFVGAGVGPIALGWVIDSWSFHAAWLVVGTLLAAASLVVLVVAVQRRSPSPVPQEG